MECFRNIFGSLFIFCLSMIKIRCQRQTPILGTISTPKIELAKLTSSGYEDFLELLKPIAIKRVSDTDGNRIVREFISSKMSEYGWIVERNSFQDSTPYGNKNFENLIATYPIGSNLAKSSQLITSPSSLNENFNTKNRVVFACHYDSKLFTDFDFIGAIDSAVPCAMLLDLAKFLNENFNKNQFARLGRHVQFIFFDGEEAFKDWSQVDSIYGAKNLAKQLANTFNQKAFDTIDLFVLLDLIGASTCKFPNFFPSTSSIYRMLSRIETSLIKKKLLSITSSYFFTDTNGQGFMNRIEDDHLPFLNKGVPILHLIPAPFPKSWHNKLDTLENLDQNNIQDLRIIFKYFLLQILNTNQQKQQTRADDEF